MKKIDEFKKALKTPPPERLARIEYRSHFFQMLGISVVCVVLILKGLWYIIFAFVFGLGISYSQGMSAYIKYRNIMALIKPESVEDYEGDISPTRKRSKIIKHVLGNLPNQISIILAVSLSYLIIGLGGAWYIKSFAYLILIPMFYVLLYFFGFYWLAYPNYKKEIKLKGGKKK
jgi:hypothetical protein